VTGDYFLDDTIPAELRELGSEVRFKPLWLEDPVTLIRGLLTPAIADVDRVSDLTKRKSNDEE
jgi:hypothetical protein